jgi:hypothetical protein
MESYASIELGVAKIEIMYQEDLKCIAMTSNGWRCQEIIFEEPLLQARELLSSSVKSEGELDTEILPRLVLCPGHARGELPRIYSERWAAFAEQRLPKEEAMSKFNADFWMSVQFFDNARSVEPAFPNRMRRPRSESHISAWQSEKHDFVNAGRPGGDSLRPPLNVPSDFQRHEFEFSLPDNSAQPKFTKTSKNRNFLKNQGAHRISPEEWRQVFLTTPNVPAAVAAAPQPALASLSTASGLKPTDTSTMSEAFNCLRLTSELPQPVADASSVLQAVTEEVTPLEAQTRAQNAPPGMSATPPLSEEATKSSTVSHSQETIDSNLIKEMTSPIPHGGYVYILKSFERNLVKIGKYTDLNLLLQQIKVECQLKSLVPVEVGSIYVKHPERVAKLVHLELQNFRARTTCQHQHGASDEAVEQEHTQWFDVLESVAVRSVKLWRDFVNLAYTTEGAVSKDWAGYITTLPKPSSLEILYLEKGLGDGDETEIKLHHELRLLRYTEWVAQGPGSGTTKIIW